MPRDRRPSSTPEGDSRPAFSRPPGATRVSASPNTSGSPAQSPRRHARHKSRTKEVKVTIEEEGEEEEDEEIDVFEENSGLPASNPRKNGRPRHKAKESPVPSPEKARRPRRTHDHANPGSYDNSRDRRERKHDGARDRDRDRERDRERRGERDYEVRRQHKRKISAPVKESPRAERERDRDRAKYNSGTSSGSTSQLLSADALAKLNSNNERQLFEEQRQEKKKKEKHYKNLKAIEEDERRRRRRKQKERQVSGAIMEEGRAGAGAKRRRAESGYAYDEEDEEWNEKRYGAHSRGNETGGGGRRGGVLGFWKTWSRKRKILVIFGISVVILLIIIIAAVVASKNKSSKNGGGGGGSDSGSGSSPKLQNTCDGSSVPADAKGTYTDISTWLDTTDFNCTYTSETVGNLSIMGLNSNWDDSKRANPNVPPLDQAWQYGKMPIRGTNLGGWLDLEPFITPSLFNYAASDKVVDEWTLCQKLGQTAPRLLENHYATFITKQDFEDIAAAGLDHVRIPYPYWAVRTYDGDPYVPQIAWRYLLRGIEYARENGIRVNLDLHSAPGSQNGWAHSGHQGSINWLVGTNGAENAQRTIDLHNQLSTFFAQDRYKNVVTFYGLINEPKMLVIPHDAVLDWNKKAIAVIRGNGIQQQIVFGDGFLALNDWDDLFKGVDPNLAMDTHQYQIFNTGQLKLKHQDKINLACTGWSGMLVAVNDPQTGWGPTFNGEWSQADTDCTPNLNNVGVGSRWAGTLNTGDPGTSVLTQTCATPPCSCDKANADPSTYSADYKQFLKMFAEAQMHAFEQAWGWFYWTWKTEKAAQWSWKLGLNAGILPSKAYAPDFKCDSTVPDFSNLPESY